MLDNIVNDVKRLIKRSGTRDPYEIAADTGAIIEFVDLGRLKDMYTVIQRNRFIVINPNLDEYQRRLVCAHELGHDQLHRNFAGSTGFREFMLYDMTLRPEYKANVFV